MRTNINIKKAPIGRGLLFVLLLFWNMLSGQNVALHFDGANDYVTLSPINGLGSTNSDFTVEMQFFSTATDICSGSFHRLFSLGSVAGTGTRFEVGECGGFLNIYWYNVATLQKTLVLSTLNIRGAWHCLSVVRSGNNVTTYLDGVLVIPLTSTGVGTLNNGLFRLGHWPSTQVTPNNDWEGYVDEVKLWKTALTSTQLTACSPCVLIGNEPNLIAYWRLDDGVPNGINTGSTVKDATTNVNNGVFSSPLLIPAGFTLMDPTGLSNFTPSTAPILYPQYTNLEVLLTDPLPTGGLTSICSGDPVHFSIVDANGVAVKGGKGATVAWEYSDDCVNWNPTVPIAPVPPPPQSALFSGFSFVSTPGHSALDCGNPPNKFVDRCYRAIITVSNGVNTCTYSVKPAKLKICCPVSNVSLNVSPAGPLCQGDMVQFTATVNSNMPAPASPGNNVHINWMVIINGQMTQLMGPLYDDKVTINYPSVTLPSGTICFKATISNCACPPVIVQTCVTVDLKPVCGTITGSPTPATLKPGPDGNPDHYLICPGDDAAVQVASPFINCNQVWQYMFPSVGTWNDFGSGNSTQNTNVLPHLKPQPPPLPDIWPAGETCILYRIKCLPLTYPNSGCQPCYSNEVRICLRQEPPAPVITADPPQICEGAESYLSVQNPDLTCSYQWYSDGFPAGSGDSYNASNNACYWVTCNDGCFEVTSNTVCLDVCESVAIISCPFPTCPCVNEKITLDGFGSYSTCGYSLDYVWTWTDQNGVHTFSGPVLMDIPQPTGTTYTLTVIDTVLDCTGTAQTTIVPCTN